MGDCTREGIREAGNAGGGVGGLSFAARSWGRGPQTRLQGHLPLKKDTLIFSIRGTKKNHLKFPKTTKSRIYFSNHLRQRELTTIPILFGIYILDIGTSFVGILITSIEPSALC